jgi:hypothetical protein
VVILESAVERRFVRYMKQSEDLCLCLKFTCQGSTGWPDRMVLLPKGRVVFVEFKRPGGKLRPLQKERHRQLKELGHEVWTTDDPTKAAYWVARQWRKAKGKNPRPL